MLPAQVTNSHTPQIEGTTFPSSTISKRLRRAPALTGKTFSRLENSDASSPAAEPVTLETDPRQGLNAALKKPKLPAAVAPTEEIVTVKGVLRGLQLDKDWLDVATDDGDPQRPTRIFQAGDVLDDVIGPMVNHRAIVTAIRRNACDFASVG